ncbi:hypothetical protein [Lactobacillus porci]|uniref:hypothetical protein n=1 Tax=Lactobacillus porci TaxID=2012477 RepID=UPI00399669DC
MSKGIMKAVKIAAASLAWLTLAGCAAKQEPKSSSPKSSKLSKRQVSDNSAMGRLSQGRKLFYWTVYWDVNGPIKTIEQHAASVDGVGDFAAIYDENKNDQLFLTDGAKKLLKQLRANSATKQTPVYMTVVNDTRTEDKSTDLVSVLLSSKAQAKQQAKEIVALAKKHQFDGVEMDYEQIRDDTGLWKKFAVFEKELWSLCQKEQLKLRVVLEPSTPVKKISLVKGPEYVVMCYNLYGFGSAPGPKANRKFLVKTAKSFESLGKVSYALSNGGFDFGTADGTDVTSLTTSDVKKLIKRKKAKPVRDKASGAMHFSYGSHEVWYADDQTLQIWAKTLDEAAGRKVDLSIWRME